MNRSERRRATLAVLFISCAICLLFLFPSGERPGHGLRIGVPDSAASLIIEYIVHEKMARGAAVVDRLDIYPTKDCCTSTSEWALASGDLQMALLCPDAAERLVRKDPRYEIAGPCMVNSDVAVVRSGKNRKPEKIGVAERRDLQIIMIKKLLGKESIIVPMLASAIPYAYEKRAVDGVVIDVLRGFLLEGEMLPLSGDREDLVTYVLVVQKSFKAHPLYCRFLTSYKEAQDELRRDEVLAGVMRRYKHVEQIEERVKRWKQMNIRFTIPRDLCSQEERSLKVS